MPFLRAIPQNALGQVPDAKTLAAGHWPGHEPSGRSGIEFTMRWASSPLPGSQFIHDHRELTAAPANADAAFPSGLELLRLRFAMEAQ